MAKLTAEQRREVIAAAAIRVATDGDLWNVTHGSVAKRCVVPTSLDTVRHYYPTKLDLWRAVLSRVEDARLNRQAVEMGFTL